jgi:diguanylate cyclase (GGDEF)-like protein/PAS domain S-box-containing protein
MREQRTTELTTNVADSPAPPPGLVRAISPAQYVAGRWKQSIGRRVLAAILLCSTLLAFVATGVQLLSDFMHDASLIKQRLAVIEQSYLESIAVSTWNFDSVLLNTQLQGILRLPDICSVKVEDTSKTVTGPLGTCSPRFDVIERVYPIVFARNAEKNDVVRLGSLTVTASYEQVFLRLQDRVLVILATQGIKTFIIAILILYLFHRLVGHPLSLLANAARRLNINQLSQPIVLERGNKPAYNNDELGVLVTAMNSMRQSLLEDFYELQSTKEALQSSQERYRSLVESTNVISWEADPTMRNFTYVGPQAQRLLGYPHERWCEEDFWFSAIHPEDRARVDSRLRHPEVGHTDIECRFIKADGAEHWLSIQAERRTLPSGETVLQGFLIDIDSRKRTEIELDRYRANLEKLVASRTEQLADNVLELEKTVGKLNSEIIERELAERTLRENEERYRLLIEMSPDAVMIEQDGEIVFVNNGAVQLFGANSTADIIGKSMRDFAPLDCRLDVSNRLQKLLQGQQYLRPEEEKIVRMNGAVLDVEVSRALFHYRGRPAIQAVVHDITPHKTFAEQLRKQALYDALTGMPNRALLMDRLNDAIAVAERKKQPLVVVFIDLDHFKLVNDSLGHDAGDQLLITVARRISGCIRKSDTLARLGGDEFVILLREATENEAILKLINNINAEVSRPVTLSGQELTVTCSIGFSTYPEHGKDAATLIKHSDAAMYRAKDQGRNRVHSYTADLQVQVDERLLMESQLRRALEKKEFVMHYQPVIDLQTGSICAVESLVRWQHPDLGLLPPRRFIGAAEEMGLIGPLGEWIMRSVCTQASIWQKHGLRTRIGINLSLQQFQDPQFERTVRQILAELHLTGRDLQFELTETVSMQDPENTIRILTRLKAQGVDIMIDDFGTGYSNLAYLTRFPVDYLKVDRSFVQDLTLGSDRTIVETIITMAHKLHLKVVAEGVETEKQFQLLKSYGCDAAQGFYFSAAVPAEACTRLLQQRDTFDPTTSKCAGTEER